VVEARDLEADKITFRVNDGLNFRTITGGIGGKHADAQGAWAMCADGAVYCLEASMKPDVLKALSTIAGGEKVDWPPPR